MKFKFWFCLKFNIKFNKLKRFETNFSFDFV